jgi:hypothetical protein
MAEKLNTMVSSPQQAPTTPASSSPTKPPMKEMHPSKVHPTMAPPSSPFTLGFTDIKPTENARNQPSGVRQSTPTKVGVVPSSPFTFRFVKPTADLGLSNEARRMMDELREEAAKIRANLVAKREEEKAAEEVGGRKIAKPKGKSGRFSSAHMMEFKKMDSIEGHASSFRAQPGRFTPVAQGIKRSSSRANLDDAPSTVSRSLKRSPSKANLDDAPNTNFKSSLKRSPSKANMDETLVLGAAARLKSSPSKVSLDDGGFVYTKKSKAPQSPSKLPSLNNLEPPSPAKRAKQRFGDDTSNSRPVSRDGSSIPRPKSSGNDTTALPKSQSNLAALMGPTKSSLARATSIKGPSSVGTVNLVNKPESTGLKKSAPFSSLKSPEKTPSVRQRVISPGRFEKVKSILRGTKFGGNQGEKSAIPAPSSMTIQTPGPTTVNTQKKLPALPFTTPRRKLVKRVEFTPDTKRAVLTGASPSPLKSEKSVSKSGRTHGEVYYPALDMIIAEEASKGVSYPDLTAHHQLAEPASRGAEIRDLPTSTPGTFTFRSDHTIRFGSASPTGFGSSPGQSSVRHVRTSMLPTAHMPGSFPSSSTVSHPNKENKSPGLFTAVPHGIINKKRHRVSTDEDEAEIEAANRAAKKRKNASVPEGEALLAPRLVGTSMATTPRQPERARAISHTPSPTKKRAVLSLSRLNMLARPKVRN